MKFASTLLRVLSATALLFAPPVLAQEVAPPPPAETAEAPAKTGTPAMWKVSDEDTTIYLFGTVHFLPKDVNWFGDTIEDALTSADLIVEELGPEPPSLADQQAIAGLAMMTPPATLSNLLEEEDAAKFQEQLSKLNLSSAEFEMYKPWFASLRLVIAHFDRIGFDPKAGVESVLQREAPDIPREGLETVVGQFRIFAGLSEERQIQYLMEAVNNMDEIEPGLRAMLDLWLAGDAEGLAAVMNESMEEADVAEAMLYKRNANWTDWIEQRLNTPGTVFMAVGAGHLAGEKSVQDMLAQREILVERVQ